MGFYVIFSDLVNHFELDVYSLLFIGHLWAEREHFSECCVSSSFKILACSFKGKINSASTGSTLEKMCFLEVTILKIVLLSFGIVLNIYKRR